MSNNSVYLTFDDGPTPQLTAWIVDYLEQENISATFFCVGANILNHSSQYKLVKENGHQLGSHTMRHENSAKTDWKTYRKSVEDCADLVGNKLFRPPYGRLNMRKSFLLSRKYRIVMWSWLSYDYDKTVSIESILASAKKDIQAGDILVLHDNEKVEERLKKLLPELVKIVREKNLKFARIV
jgi:peptidoglycan/xylan/chitin deacetylase (PgdA/CDA1 family)